MYPYISSGFANVWLKNGYDKIETPYGIGIAIHKLDELHFAILETLLYRPNDLLGSELRFLRKLMGMDEVQLGEILNSVPGRFLYFEKSQPNREIHGSLDRLLRLAVYEFINKKTISLHELNKKIKAGAKREPQYPGKMVYTLTDDQRWQHLF